MNENQIGDLVASVRDALKEENAALEARLQDALERGDWIFSFARDYDNWFDRTEYGYWA